MMKQQGFSLLELLVAISIFAIAGVSIMKVSGEHLIHLSILEDQTVSSWVAENRLSEVQLEEQWPPQNNKKGKTELAGRDWFWKQIVKKTEDQNMREITVQVFVTEKAEAPVYELRTFVGNKK